MNCNEAQSSKLCIYLKLTNIEPTIVSIVANFFNEYQKFIFYDTSFRHLANRRFKRLTKKTMQRNWRYVFFEYILHFS